MFHFVGNIDAKIDAKSRVFLPVAFRKVLMAKDETSLILRKDIFQDCLTLYPESVWNEEIAVLKSKLSRWNKSQAQLLRQFVIDAERVEIDANGRLLLPKRYLEMVNISSDAKFIGVDNTIEVWAKETLENTLLSSDDFGSMIENLMNDNNE